MPTHESYLKYKEKIKTGVREWQARNRQIYNNIKKEWRSRNKDKLKANVKRYQNNKKLGLILHKPKPKPKPNYNMIDIPIDLTQFTKEVEERLSNLMDQLR